LIIVLSLKEKVVSFLRKRLPLVECTAIVHYITVNNISIVTHFYNKPLYRFYYYYELYLFINTRYIYCL